MRTSPRRITSRALYALIAASLAATPALGQNTAIVPALSPAMQARHASFLEVAKKGDIDVLLMGDSITDWWRTTGLAVFEKNFGGFKCANFGIAGDRTQGVLWRMDNGELEGYTPKLMMLMIGTNNLGRMPTAPAVAGATGAAGAAGAAGVAGTAGAAGAAGAGGTGRAAGPGPGNTPAEIAEGITAVVTKFRTKFPQARVLLLGVFPRSARPDAWQRESIKQINAIIAKLDDGRFVRYMDIGDKFLEPDGTISVDVMRDGLHPTAKGYEIWAAAVMPAITELLARR